MFNILLLNISYAISKVIVGEYGQQEFLRRLSDPLWFQAFGCVLGFDWHSSGITTVVTGVLKQSLSEDIHGISVAGGKGRKATEVKNDIPKLAEKHFNLSSGNIDSLLYANKMAAKIDNAAVQDGYSLYHHVILFDKHGNWSVVQQGMNSYNKMARRYHWISDDLKGFVCEPHAGIISECKSSSTLNMTSIDFAENQKVCLELAINSINNNMKQRMMGIPFSIKSRDAKDRYIESNFKNLLAELTSDLINYGSDIVFRKLLISTIALEIAQNMGIDYHAATEELYYYMRKNDQKTHEDILAFIDRFYKRIIRKD